ncbi:HT motif gene family protein [Canarypox virus]|uniref:SWPV2-ORF268 n=2 Tax=Canarypox virus TaxID=44088 RepID=A0A1V0QGN1_CNPV|nr:HT motif gene family protein [Canarypox virus]ARE67519.1 SWPV2-ORF268 [Shearwaterpox virus]QRM15561.1 HT motif protein [Mudlarkpox virus]QRM15914.1 ht motif protein [Penguinpox virus 2]QRM16251.1 ht motif protein [Albatrosspox virus]AAR83628.1 CNPV282 HT motif protein [Canarypox virus]
MNKYLFEGTSKEELFCKKKGICDIKTLIVSNNECFTKIFRRFHEITDNKFNTVDQYYQIGTYSLRTKYEFDFYITESDYLKSITYSKLDNIFMIKIMPVKSISYKELRSIIDRKCKNRKK